jgi:tricarballylate dehydrogenase
VKKFDANYDLVIVGCGAAGLAAALSTVETAAEEREGDLAVVVLERARKEERGGNTRWTSAYLRLKDMETVADRFVEDMLEFSGGRSDERYIHALAERIPETIGWVQAKGVRFDYLPTFFLTLAQPRLQPVGGGAAIVETLARRIEELGITILYETSAQRLVLDESGTVTGLEASGPDGHPRRLGARAVVIAFAE